MKKIFWIYMYLFFIKEVYLKLQTYYLSLRKLRETKNI